MSELKKYDTVVIGAGASGLAAALRRRKRGDSVLLIEKNDRVGGKLDVLEWEEFRWDKGPSLFTMPELILDLFKLYDKNPADYFEYRLHHENCRYHFPDGTSFIFYSDPEKRKESLRKVFSIEAVERAEKYIKKIAKTYESIGDMFIGRPKLSVKDALKPEVIKQYPKIVSRQMLYSLNAYNERTLKDPKLVQLFNRFGTYNGSNPYQMSGLYSMIPHLELNLGTYFPKGGMRAIVESLATLAREQGVDIALNEDNTNVQPIGDQYEVALNDEVVTASKVICAIDHVNFYKHILKDEDLYQKFEPQERSSSAIVFYWAVKGDHPEIGLHNIFFTSDYKNEFEELFDKKINLSEPTIYIHNSSTVEKDDAPEGHQNWFVMVHSPAGVQPTEDYLENLRTFIKSRVKDAAGIDLEGKVLFEDNWTMEKVERITGSYKGALYGGAFNTKMSSFIRHGNKSKKYKNLYFTGGSVHPGGGIPLVLKSAKIVDDLIEGNR